MINYDPFFDFTGSSRHILSKIVNHPEFKTLDSDMIFDGLSNYLTFIPFSSFLKRQLYKTMDLKEDPQSIPDKTYKKYISNQFKGQKVPTSLDGQSNESIGEFASRMLNDKKQKDREDVLILGFGLNLSADNVHELLTKGLSEPGFNAKNPVEDICYYCYKNGYSYSKFEELKQRFDKLNPTDNLYVISEKTKNIRTGVFSAENDDELMAILSGLKTTSGESLFSITTLNNFIELFRKAAELIRDDKQRLYDEVFDKELRELRAKEENSKKHLISESSAVIADKIDEKIIYELSDVTASDFERVMNSSIPRSKSNNLPAAKAASLGAEFASKGLRRGRLSDVLNGKEITRYDLINLNFFIHARTYNIQLSRNQRMKDFLESTNKILKDCNMAPIYAGNPYECFIVMCMVSRVPLVTYADVWALTYNVNEGKLNDLNVEADYE